MSRRVAFGVSNRPQSGHTGLRCLLPSGPYHPPPGFHSLLNAAWDSLTCSVRSGLVKLSVAQFASEHTQRGSRVKYYFTCSQTSSVIRSWVCVFRERPFLRVSCIGLLSTSTTAVLLLRQPGWAVVASLSISCSANVSLTLICALCHAARKSAAALKTENAPNCPLIRPPHAWDEASVAPEIVRTCRVASYQGAPFSRLLTSHHLSISNRRPLRFDSALDDRFFRPPERLNVAIWRYMWCVYRLAGGTATGILVHFPGSFSSWLNDILRLPIASRRIASSFRSLSCGTQNLRCAVSQPTLRKTRSVVGSRGHFGKAIKKPQR